MKFCTASIEEGNRRSAMVRFIRSDPYSRQPHPNRNARMDCGETPLRSYKETIEEEFSNSFDC
ncbi:hypothetical protein RRSWK_05286 [Rhodopirellula sp. SWK7]|nr:hypothetical protein RRSWK_05286 [Rhodopirellula sp. SWK7]